MLPADAKRIPTGDSPSISEIQGMLVSRIDAQKLGVGIVVGIIDAKGRRVISYGSLKKGDRRPLDGDTVFEIGSVTKVFTALRLADMVQRAEVAIADPIAKYLPPSAKVPERGGRQITLVDLATHSSGLPRMPENFRPQDPANPYADYTNEQLDAFLSSYEPIRDIGVKYEYSNLGFGLLGQVLARRADMEFETLVINRICEPLGMSSTRSSLSSDMEHRLAAGHSADLISVSKWDIPTLAGAGGLRSSANDLLKILAAAMGNTKTPLKPAMDAMLAVKRPTGQPFIDTALGWIIDTRGGSEIIFHDGGTGGYRAFIGYAPRSGVGIVTLSNAATNPGVADLGLHLLDARYPLAIPDGSPREAAVSSLSLERYIGYYEMAPNFVLTVTRKGDQLYVQETGQAGAAIYSKSDHEFFYKVVNAQISFETNVQGQVTGLVLHQNGLDHSAKRIEEVEAKKLDDAVARRFREQTPIPGSEAATRHLIDEIQRCQVDYELFTPQFALRARQNESSTQTLLASLGALQMVTFKRVDPGGADIYEARFDGGSIIWRIVMASDGKIAGVGIEKSP